MFNSINYAVFLPFVLAVYYAIPSIRHRQAFLLFSSFVFYSFTGFENLSILLFISSTAFISGALIERANSSGPKKAVFLSSLFIQAGTLIVFKSYFSQLMPPGLSFYTFISISYTADVYLKRSIAFKDPVNGMLSLSYFPVLLSGPVIRPAPFVSALEKKTGFDPDLAREGLRRILWGLFIKAAVADNCAAAAEEIFSLSTDLNGGVLFAGAVLYSVRIYADFAGYSEMAIGTSALFGIRIGRNFKTPYFSKNITEFWKGWHISLTEWFRDYVFLPLSLYLSRKMPSERTMGINSEFLIYTGAGVLTWTLTGLWHGSGSAFLAWGLFHFSLLLFHRSVRKPFKKLLTRTHSRSAKFIIKTVSRVIFLFCIVCSWVIFRSESIFSAFSYIISMVTPDKYFFCGSDAISGSSTAFFMAMIMFATEFFCKGEVPEAAVRIKKTSIRWMLYFLFIAVIFLYGRHGDVRDFIYFQF
jgi:alginate O-acetyltransferase complex protein AlgI